VLPVAAKQMAAGYANIHGQLLAPTGELTMGESARGAVNHNTAQLEAEKTARQKATQAKVYNAADKLSQSAAKQETESKAKLGKVGGLLYDAGVMGGQIAGDTAMSVLVPGSGFAAGMARGYGSGSLAARQSGKSEDKQVISGAKDAVSFLVAGKIMNGLAGVYGESAANGIVKNVAAKLGKSEAGQLALNRLGNMGEQSANMALISALNPVADKVLGLSEKGKPLYTKEDAENILHDAIVGAIMGAAGNVGNSLTGRETADLADIKARARNYQKAANIKAGYASKNPMTAEEAAQTAKVAELNRGARTSEQAISDYNNQRQAQGTALTDIIRSYKSARAAAEAPKTDAPVIPQATENSPQGAQNAAETVFASENVIPPAAAENAPTAKQDDQYGTAMEAVNGLDAIKGVNPQLSAARSRK
jgi:hypothetical protein